MQNYTVRELMVPLSEYATTHEGTTLYEAVMALEKAQVEFDHNKYRHRAILILNKNNRVVGKLSQLDVLRALETESENKDHLKGIEQFGFSAGFLWKVRKQGRFQESTITALCGKAAKIKVEDIMQTPTEGEYVDQNASLVSAVEQLVFGNHLSLLVTRGKDIVGILRLTDAFAAVFHVIKECELSPKKEKS
jgi:CBS domain-containing protein